MQVSPSSFEDCHTLKVAIFEADQPLDPARRGMKVGGQVLAIVPRLGENEAGDDGGRPWGPRRSPWH